ncbi:MAG: PIN domain-containing protein [Proteobacteria bacterium]|nr:PIN domain-containing protein [Pseudomonadota bacterium]
MAHLDLVDPIDLGEAVCEDPDDDKFLACALAARAKVVVSGDRHLLQVSGYRGVEVVRPRALLESLKAG